MGKYIGEKVIELVNSFVQYGDNNKIDIFKAIGLALKVEDKNTKEKIYNEMLKTFDFIIEKKRKIIYSKYFVLMIVLLEMVDETNSFREYIEEFLQRILAKAFIAEYEKDINNSILAYLRFLWYFTDNQDRMIKVSKKIFNSTIKINYEYYTDNINRDIYIIMKGLNYAHEYISLESYVDNPYGTFFSKEFKKWDILIDYIDKKDDLYYRKKQELSCNYKMPYWTKLLVEGKKIDDRIKPQYIGERFEEIWIEDWEYIYKTKEYGHIQHELFYDSFIKQFGDIYIAIIYSLSMGDKDKLYEIAHSDMISSVPAIDSFIKYAMEEVLLFIVFYPHMFNMDIVEYFLSLENISYILNYIDLASIMQLLVFLEIKDKHIWLAIINAVRKSFVSPNSSGVISEEQIYTFNTNFYFFIRKNIRQFLVEHKIMSEIESSVLEIESQKFFQV